MGLHHQSYLGCSFNRCAGGVGTRCGVPRRPPSARGAPSELACFPSAGEPPEIVLVSPPPDTPPEHVLVSPQMQALTGTVLVAPVPRDGSFSGLERDQLATPLAHVEWPDSQSTSLVAPLPDRVPPHLKWFLAHLAVPVRCAMRSFSSILPSWSRSMWWPAFLRHASHLLHCDHAIPALSAGALGTSFCAPNYNTAIFPPFCGAPSVGVPSPGGGTRVPYYLVGDVVAH